MIIIIVLDKMNGGNHSLVWHFFYIVTNKIKRRSIQETMKELDLTQGSVPKVLLRFAVPFLIANVLQTQYGGADLFVVGQYDDSASVAAVSIGSQVMQTMPCYLRWLYHRL